MFGEGLILSCSPLHPLLQEALPYLEAGSGALLLPGCSMPALPTLGGHCLGTGLCPSLGCLRPHCELSTGLATEEWVVNKCTNEQVYEWAWIRKICASDPCDILTGWPLWLLVCLCLPDFLLVPQTLSFPALRVGPGTVLAAGSPARVGIPTSLLRSALATPDCSWQGHQ